MGGAGYGNHDTTRPGDDEGTERKPGDHAPAGPTANAPRKPDDKPRPAAEGGDVRPQGDEVDPGTG
jgi:hypothetical protein